MARDNRIDSIKGLLIILVILGHNIIALDNANVINHGVMGLIYIFHMPLFILISGYLTKHPSQQSASHMWRGVGHIAVPLVIFQVLVSLRIQLMGGHFLEAMAMFPFGLLWYLLSLMCWRIMLYYTPRSLLNTPWLYLGIALVVSLLIGLTRLGLFLSIQRTLNFYLFFLLGFYYKQGVANTRLWHNNLLHGIIVIALLPLLFWLFPHCGNVMNGADHYGIEGLPEKIMVLTCSIAMSLLVFNLMRDNKWLRIIGKDSLFYYLYDMFVSRAIIIPIVLALGGPRTLPFIILYTLLAVVLMWCMSKVHLFKWIIHPTFKSKTKKED